MLETLNTKFQSHSEIYMSHFSYYYTGRHQSELDNLHPKYSNYIHFQNNSFEIVWVLFNLFNVFCFCFSVSSCGTRTFICLLLLNSLYFFPILVRSGTGTANGLLWRSRREIFKAEMIFKCFFSVVFAKDLKAVLQPRRSRRKPKQGQSFWDVPFGCFPVP